MDSHYRTQLFLANLCEVMAWAAYVNHRQQVLKLLPKLNGRSLKFHRHHVAHSLGPQEGHLRDVGQTKTSMCLIFLNGDN